MHRRRAIELIEQCYLHVIEVNNLHHAIVRYRIQTTTNHSAPTTTAPFFGTHGLSYRDCPHKKSMLHPRQHKTSDACANSDAGSVVIVFS